MLNVRISEEAEKELNRYCTDEGLSKSMVVKEALEVYLSQRRKTKSACEAGAGLFGQEGSGFKNLSVTYKKKLKEKLNAKYAR
jgi:predicted transcriptional regulator